MASRALQHWQNERLPRLDLIVHQCQGVAGASPADMQLIEENLRAYTMLLSAHFQGFCRDLHSECAQVIASKVRKSLAGLTIGHFSNFRGLDHGNPTMQNIRQDFARFNVTVDFVAHDPINETRLSDLAELNRWRNIAAHHSDPPSGSTLTLTVVQRWHSSCDTLAESLDAIVYNQMSRLLKRNPW